MPHEEENVTTPLARTPNIKVEYVQKTAISICDVTSAPCSVTANEQKVQRLPTLVTCLRQQYVARVVNDTAEIERVMYST